MIGLVIPDPDADFKFLPIPDPGSRGQKGTGSRIRIRNTDYILSPHSRREQKNLYVTSISGLDGTYQTTSVRNNPLGSGKVFF
jgi:hypothetical protein